MAALSIGWIPGITGRHLPVPIIPRCYATTACCRRNVSSQLLRVSASATGKNTQLSMKISTFHVGEAPLCEFLPRISSCNRNLRTYSTRRRLCRTYTGRLLAVTPSALSRDQEDHQALQKNSQLGTSLSEFVPNYLQPSASELKEGCSSFNGGYEREIFHREMLSRLEAAEAAAAQMISDPDHEPLRSAGSSDMLGNSLALEDENWLVPMWGGTLRERGKLQLDRTHNQLPKETRMSIVKNSSPPISGRLTFRSLPKDFPDWQIRERAARMNFTVSYQMSCILETDYALDVAEESVVDVLNQNGILEAPSSTYCSRKTAMFARDTEYWMACEDSTSANMCRMPRGRVNQMGLRQSTSHSGVFRYGRDLDTASKLDGTLRYRPTYGTGRRLWSRAHSGVESAGNLFKDLLAIFGLVAFVVYGTYAFAMSQKHLKSGLWFRKTPSESVGVGRSEQETTQQTFRKPASLNQTKVAEITDDNFVDTIQKRPTFVLFYASWCPYCQKLDPTWKELGNILSNKGYNIQLARMDAETHSNTAANFKVVKYPTLIFFRGGIAVENYMGPRTVNSLVEFVDETLNKPS